MFEALKGQNLRSSVVEDNERNEDHHERDDCERNLLYSRLMRQQLEV
jgi:hypothetical protein